MAEFQLCQLLIVLSMKKIIVMLGIISIIAGCNSSDSAKQQIATETSGKDSLINIKSSLSDNELDHIIESIPSPLEFSSLIQFSGAAYQQSLLNNTDNRSKYNSQFNKSVNLGIYGADLGYINIYGKTYSAMEYLNSVYQLASDLNIGNYFDFNTLKRLATNNKNLDSVVYITTKGFEKMHYQLKKSHNSQISILILAGGWVESVYLTTGIIQSGSSPKAKDLMFTIYDEKIVLEDILKLTTSYKGNPNFDKLIADLEKLKAIYAAITTTNSASNASLSQEQFNEIAKEVKAIRTKLIE